MFEKETKDEKYRNNPYKSTNFKCDENGNLICAKAADELLTISDITASFVMAKVQDKVYISGR